MVDNVAITPGTGATVAADDIAGVLHQRVKISQGADGVAADVSSAAPLQVTGANGTFPVTGPLTDTQLRAVAVPVSGTVTVTDGAGTLSVDDAGGTLTVDDGGTTISIDDGAGSITIDGAVTVSSGTITTVTTVSTVTAVTDITNNVKTVGPTAADAALTTAPVTVGGLAKTALPTAVTDDDVVNALRSKYGESISRLALREALDHQFTTITASTSETTIVTADVSNKLDIIGLLIGNTSATAINVAIKDSTAGTTRTTIMCPAGATVGFVSSAKAMVQKAAANNNWTATCSASVSSILITAMFERSGA